MPLDLLMMYFWRARRSAARQPQSSRLQWLEAIDVEERSVWVAAFRETNKTLGQVIKETMQMRDAHWLPRFGATDIPPPHVPALTAKQTLAVSNGVSSATVPQPKGKGKAGKGNTIKGKQVATCLKDRTKLCMPFQSGR